MWDTYLAETMDMYLADHWAEKKENYSGVRLVDLMEILTAAKLVDSKDV